MTPPKPQCFWDLRAESLELQALEPVKSFEEMRGHGAQPDSVLDIIVGRLRLSRSINRYLLRLLVVPNQSPFLIWERQSHHLRDHLWQITHGLTCICVEIAVRFQLLRKKGCSYF